MDTTPDVRVITKWFATNVDRCFETGNYGNGVRFYYNTTNGFGYSLIKGISYDEITNTLVISSDNGNIKLTDDPDLEWFDDTVKTAWKKWDDLRGEAMEEDRCDYRPWAYASIKSLALEFRLCINDPAILPTSRFHA
jgi:hypothetical protein